MASVRPVKANEIQGRINRLLDFLTVDPKLLTGVLRLICFHLESFCGLAWEDPLRMRNSSYNSVIMLSRLLDLLRKQGPSTHRAKVEGLVETYFDEFQETLCRVLRFEARASPEVRIQHFKLEGRVGLYTLNSFQLFCHILQIKGYHPDFLERIHSTLIFRLFQRFLSLRMSNIFAAQFTSFFLQLIESAKEAHLTKLLFKFEVLNEFKTSIIALKRDGFDCALLFPDRKTRQNILDVEGLWVSLLEAIVARERNSLHQGISANTARSTEMPDELLFTRSLNLKENLKALSNTFFLGFYLVVFLMCGIVVSNICNTYDLCEMLIHRF